MALTPEEAQRLQKLLLEIEKLSERLKKNIDTTSLRDLEKSAGTIEQLFTSLSDEWEGMTEDISFAISGFQRVVQEISNVNIGLKDSNKAYKGLVSLAQELQSHQYGTRELSSDQIKKLAEQAKLERQRIANAQELIKEKKKEQESDLERLKKEKELKKLKIEELQNLKTRTEDQDKALKEHKKQLEDLNSQYEKGNESLKKTTDIFTQNQAILNNQDGLYEGLLSALDDEIRKAKNLEKALGLSGAAVDGIGKALNKAGLGALADRMGLDEAKAKMKEVAHSVTQGGNKAAGLVGQFKILKAGIGSLGGSIMKNLTDPLVMAGVAAKAVSAGVGGIKKGFSLLKGGVSSVLGFVKNLWGMADQFAAVFEKYAKAGQFAAQNFSAVGGQVNAITSGLNAAAAADPFMRVSEAGPAMKALVDGTGMLTTEMTKSVKSAHDLTYWLGYSAEETGKLYKLGQLNNQSGSEEKDVLKETLISIKAKGTALNSQYKTSIDLRKVEQTAAKASSAVTYNLKQNPKAIAEAAYHATKLNMSLDEIASAAEQTLNFEQSIQDQLAYQAMSGKELNIDAYQQAALRGDTVTAAKELNNLIAQHGPGLKNNVLLQEQFAKAAGISKNQLLEGITARELATKMHEKEGDVQKRLQELQRQGLTLDEASNELAKEGLAGSLAKSKRAEAMSRALEDFRDYMATKLWPLFKAVFSPANIKMFMAVISGMRPVFVELGKAITAFFSPKSAGAMTDVIKNDVMPAILDLAKMLTEVAGVLGEALFGVIKTLGPTIKKDVVPIFKYIGGIIKEIAPAVGKVVQSLAQGLAKVFSKINEHKEDIRNFIETLANGLTNVFGFVANHLKEIAITLVAFKALTAVRSLKNAIMGSPGSSSMNPMYVKNVGVPSGAGGAAAGGGIMSKVKGFLGIGGKAAGAASATAGATSGIAGATSFADKRKMVLARQAAGEGLGSKVSSVSAGAKDAAKAAGDAGDGAAKSGSKLSKFGSGLDKAAGGMIKGAAALAIIAGALYIAAKAFQEFGMVEWEDVGKGILTLGALSVAALILSKAKGDILKGSAAMVVMGLALGGVGLALQTFAGLNWSDLAKAGVALVGLTAAVMGLGLIMDSVVGAIVFASGIAALIALGGALSILGVGFIALGKGIKELGGGQDIGKAGKELSDGLTSFVEGFSKIDLDDVYNKLWDIEDVFDIFEDALRELQGGALAEFAKIAELDIKKAVGSLQEGLQAFYLLGSSIKDSKGEVANVKMLYDYFWNLENVFDYLGTVLDEIDVDQFLNFAKLAETDLADAVEKMQEGIQAFYSIGSNVKKSDDTTASLTDLKDYFWNLEYVFDQLGTVIDEINVDQFLNFSKMAGSDLSGAVESLQEGVQSFYTSFTNIKKSDDVEASLTDLKDYFWNLEYVFDYLGTVLDEINVDQFLKFSQLASTDLVSAVEELQEGVQAFYSLGDGVKKSDDTTASLTQLKDYFWNLEYVFDYLGTVIEEIDTEALLEFSKLASADLVGAVETLQDGISSLGDLKFDEEAFGPTLASASKYLNKLGQVFSTLNSSVEELDIKSLVEFASLANADLASAATSIIDGMNSLADVDTQTDLTPLQDTFTKLNDVVGALSLDNLTKFASLANADLSAAAQNVVDGLTTLNTSITTESNINLDGVKTAFEAFDNAIGELKLDNILKFAELSKADLAEAGRRIVAGLKELNDHIDTGSSANLDKVKIAFDKFDKALSELKLDELTKLATLSNAELATAGQKIKEGLDKFAGLITKDEEAKTYESIENLEKPFKYLKDALAKMDLAQLKAFAELNLDALSTVITNLKTGLTDLTALSKDGNIGDKKTFGTLKDILSGVSNALAQLDVNKLKELAGADFTNLQTSLTTLKSAIAELVGTADIQNLKNTFETLKSIDISGLEKLSNIDSVKLKDSFVALKEGLNELSQLPDLSKLPESFELLTDALGELDFEKITEFTQIEAGVLQEKLLVLKNSLTELSTIPDISLQPVNFEAFADALDNLDFEKIAEFNLVDVFKLKDNLINLKIGLTELASTPDLGTLNALLPKFTKILDNFFDQDYSDSTVISYIKDLASIDSSKLTTLADAISKLSASFRDFGSTVSSIGDISSIVKITEHMLKLHESIVENPIDEDFASELSEGLKSSVDTVMTSLAGVFGFKKQNSTGTVTPSQDGVVHAQDGELNPNGGPVISTFQKGQLVPVMQGIKEDNVYLTTNKPQSASTGGTVVDNSAVIAAINKLTEIMASSTDKKIVVDVKSDIPAFVSKVRQTSFGG